MKVLTYRNRLGPAVVFLPPGPDGIPKSAAVPGDEELLRPAYNQVAARGPKASWGQHCKALVNSPPYAGTWTVQDVPDSYGPQQALAWVRSQDSSKSLEPEPASNSQGLNQT